MSGCVSGLPRPVRTLEMPLTGMIIASPAAPAARPRGPSVETIEPDRSVGLAMSEKPDPLVAFERLEHPLESTDFEHLTIQEQDATAGAPPGDEFERKVSLLRNQRTRRLPARPLEPSRLLDPLPRNSNAFSRYGNRA